MRVRPREKVVEWRFRLCGTSKEWGELTGEVGLDVGVGAGDAYRVDGGLVVQGMLDDFSGELGIRECRLRRRGKSKGDELALELQVRSERRAASMVRRVGSASERPARVFSFPSVALGFDRMQSTV